MDLSTFGKIIAGGKDLDCIQVGGEKIWEAPRVRSIFGNAEQDGTPSPSAPVPIRFVGDEDNAAPEGYPYKIPVEVISKNRLPIHTAEQFAFGSLTMDALSAGEFLINGTISGGIQYSDIATDVDFSKIDYIRFYVNDKTMLGDASAGLIIRFCTSESRVSLYDISVGALANGWNLLPLPAKAKAVTSGGVVAFRTVGNNQSVAGLEVKIMGVSESDKYSPFFPYGVPVKNTVYLKEPLRMVGEYADEFTPDGVIRRVFARTLDGQRMGYKVGNVGMANTVKRATVSLRAYIPNMKPISETRSVCSSDQYVYAAFGNQLGGCFVSNSVATGTLFIIHPDQSLDTPAAVNAALAIEKPTFYIPIEDTLDTDFIPERPIYVEPGQTVRVLTALQPSDTKIG